MKVRTISVLGTTFTAVVLLSPVHAEVDRRFDGTWVGKETITPSAALTAPSSGAGSGTFGTMQMLIQQRSAKIIIAGENVRSSGTVLKVEAGDCKMEITLSADGSTLTEKGTATKAFPWANGNVHYTKHLPVQVAGTFHKQQ